MTYKACLKAILNRSQSLLDLHAFPPIPYDPANVKIAEFHTSSAKIRALFGGNRSGKSESGGWELLKYCRQYPGEMFWACSESYESIGLYVWPKIKKYLYEHEIKSIAWASRAKEIPSQIRLKNGSLIVFKTYDQRRKKFQGASVKAIWLDEECPEDIYSECLARTIDVSGIIFLTMTPLQGMSWPFERIEKQVDHPTVQWWRISLLENKYIPQEEKDLIMQEYTQDEIEMRIYGRFMQLQGAVWKEFRYQIHVIPRFPIPAAWTRIRAIDFGYDDPFCCLWLACDPETGKIYVYQEHYQAERLLQHHASQIVEKDSEGVEPHEGCPPPKHSVADHDRQERAELLVHGIQTTPANKTVDLGIQIVNRYFKQEKLFIFNDLPNTLREVQSYHFKNGVPYKQDDHSQDCLRYGIMYFGVPSVSRQPAWSATAKQPPTRSTEPV
jgi:phage terminase large subunit-like protein